MGRALEDGRPRPPPHRPAVDTTTGPDLEGAE